jgi:hypothetical protein
MYFDPTQFIRMSDQWGAFELFGPIVSLIDASVLFHTIGPSQWILSWLTRAS